MTDLDKRKNIIKQLINDPDYKPLKIKEIACMMKVPAGDFNIFAALIKELSDDGDIVITDKKKVMKANKKTMLKGVFLAHANGYGFVSVGDGTEDIYIPADKVNGARHKDTVIYQKMRGSGSGKRQEGMILKIAERSTQNIVGTLLKDKSGRFFVKPDDKKYNELILIKNADLKGAVEFHKVNVEIKQNSTKKALPEGRILNIIGHINDPGVDILSIIYKHNIRTEYPQEVYDETENIQDEVSEAEIVNRRDLTEWEIFTIDGEDAKDLDDGVSIKILENGNRLLGVHIADVTHYVKEGSAFDKEALLRGTSVYLVDRVIPMLPHKLSNGICSLNPHVNRLALSCVMEINNNGDVVSHEVFTSVINSKNKLTYNIVNDIITNDASPYLEQYKEHVDSIKEMSSLSKLLYKKRINRGAIDFEMDESKIIIDENGKPIDIEIRNRNAATGLIEEFMLICNETIAEYFFWQDIPFIFRVHDKPDKEKLFKLSLILNKLGYSLKGSTHPKSMQKILEKALESPEESIISRIMLRSMAQAKYQDANLGHFGLAAKYYCHFTSPIRRYPDLYIHRRIKEFLSDNKSEKSEKNKKNEKSKKNEKNTEHIKYLRENLGDVCVQCSAMERSAQYCEWDVDALKKAEYMSDKIGQEFNGIVSSIKGWGLYVELENMVEGLVHISEMKNDYYIYDEKNLRLIGERKKKEYTLGDTVRVSVKSVNIEEGKIDFSIFEA